MSMRDYMYASRQNFLASTNLSLLPSRSLQSWKYWPYISAPWICDMKGESSCLSVKLLFVKCAKNHSFFNMLYECADALSWIPFLIHVYSVLFIQDQFTLFVLKKEVIKCCKEIYLGVLHEVSFPESGSDHAIGEAEGAVDEGLIHAEILSNFFVE